MSESETPETWPDAEIVAEDPAPQQAIVAVDRQATALAATARAMMQARVFLAMQNPRSLPRVRDALLAQVKRPSLAARAVYQIERGKRKIVNAQGIEEWVPNIIEGPSIKLANAIRVAYGNMDSTDHVLADDQDYRTVLVTAIDYENNTSESRTVVVSKTVERKGYTRKGKEYPPDREVISSRRNSYGELVYKCRATEQEVQEAQNSAASRARRNAIIALVPADLVEDAVRTAKAVTASAVAQQRAATIEKQKAFFGRIGVAQADLAAYLGRAIDDATADDLIGLEMLSTAISENAITWRAALKARQEARASDAESEPDEPSAPAPTPGEQPSKGAAAARAAVKRATEGQP